MRRQWLLAAVAAVLMASAVDAAAQTGPYIQMGVGTTLATSLAVHGSDDDWSTRCDLIINPDLAEIAAGECDTAPPRASWTNAFGGGRGIGAGVALGYDWGSIRLEGEYLHRNTVYGDQVDIDILDDVTLDKQEQEIELAYGRVDDLQSHGVFVNVYYDFGPDSASWTPYVGAGVGAERASLDYGTVWKRNDDPNRIATFVDPLLRAKLAGTTTIGQARLTDVVAGYQLLAGLDYRLGDSTTVGAKLRWAAFGRFESPPMQWDQLRSHESSVGRGAAVFYQAATDDVRFWGVSFDVKYRF